MIVKPKAYWPLVVPTNLTLVTSGGGDRNWVIPAATYTSFEAFRAAAQTALRAAHASLSAATITVSALGIITIANGAAIVIKWATATAGIPNDFGFAATNTASATSQVGAFQHANGFYSPVAVADDTLPIRNRMSDVVTRTMAGQTKNLSESELTDRTLIFRWLPPENTYKAFELTAAQANMAIERLWESGRAKFRYWPDTATEGTYFDYVMDYETIKQFQPKRQFTKKALYEVQFTLMGYVA